MKDQDLTERAKLFFKLARENPRGKKLIDSIRWTQIIKFIVDEKAEFYLDVKRGEIEVFPGDIAKMDVEDFNYSLLAKDKLWPFTVLEYMRLAISTLQGGGNRTMSGSEPSTEQKAIGGALSGAAAGGMATGGNPYGIAAGAVIGFASAFF